MDFKNDKVELFGRVGLIVLTVFFIISSFYYSANFITIIVLLVLFGFQIKSLIGYIDRSNREILNFIETIRTGDFSSNFPTNYQDQNLNKLNDALNEILEKLRKLKGEKEADFQYMKNIVQHVGIGLITFNHKGEVQIINTAAKKLLKINTLNEINELKDLSNDLVHLFLKLRTGGRDLVRLEIGEEIVQLAVYAIELTLRGEEFKLVSLQNIQNELEEKEMEAWQNLVRVLTHEIMNSVTPITSLASTIEDDLEDHRDPGKDTISLSSEDLDDVHLAIQTIKKRSQGLIRFVQDFRSLTHIPKPKLSEINVKGLVEGILRLLQNELKEKEIEVSVKVENDLMTINADKELIEQVLINLVKNAMQSFDEHTNKLIEVKAYFGEKSRPVISVRDNGSGIDPEALEKIFIPFFTTKKNGSGIGLSLSRQVMRQHQGVLGVRSKVDEGTEFFLKF